MPTKKLTDTNIKSIKPPAEGQVDYFDKGYPGFYLRISYGGRRTFGCFYRFNGTLIRRKLGTYPVMSLADAHKAWRALREEIEAGANPKTRQIKAPTNFSSVAEDWLKRDQAGKRSAPEARRIITKYVLPSWADRDIGSIGRRDILDLTDAIVDRGTPVMARRVYSRLQRLFNWSVERGVIPISPMHGMKKPASETARDRTLNDNELNAVWKTCADMGWPFGAAVQLLILTGCRREEVGQLRWSEIAVNEIRLSGKRTKNGEPHNVPLSSQALSLLDSFPRIAGCDFVFSTNGRSPIQGWSQIKKRIDGGTKLEHWRIHDLRRTVATGLQRLGIGLQVVEAVIGHIAGSRAGVVGIYQRHTYDSEKRAALQAWGDHVEKLGAR